MNDDGFRSLAGKSKHQLWLELCDIITKQPDNVKDMPVDAILRGGIRKFTDEVGFNTLESLNPVQLVPSHTFTVACRLAGFGVRWQTITFGVAYLRRHEMCMNKE